MHSTTTSFCILCCVFILIMLQYAIRDAPVLNVFFAVRCRSRRLVRPDLQKLGEQLQTAMRENNKDIPDDVLSTPKPHIVFCRYLVDCLCVCPCVLLV